MARIVPAERVGTKKNRFRVGTVESTTGPSASWPGLLLCACATCHGKTEHLTRLTAAMRGLQSAPAVACNGSMRAHLTHPTTHSRWTPQRKPNGTATTGHGRFLARRLPLQACLRSFLVCGAVSFRVSCLLSYEGMTTLPSFGACRLGPPCSLFFPSTVV